MTRKQKIYFIVGFTHSGSSIVARILNSVPNSINIGEINNYHRYSLRGDLCSCGESIMECPFWGALNIRNPSNLYFRYRELFHPSVLNSKIAYNEMIYEKMFKYCCSKFLTDSFCLIDNSKHPLRAYILANHLKDKYEVKFYFTSRSISAMLRSFRKRKNRKIRGRIEKKIWLFYPIYTFHTMQKFFIKILLYLKGIHYEEVKQEKLKLFIDNNKESLSLSKLSRDEFQILDFFNHSIGGSFTSRGTSLKIKN